MIVSSAVRVVGALVFCLAPGKAAELGRIAFSCGLLALLLVFGNRSLHF